MIEIIVFLCVSIAIGLFNSRKSDEEGYMIAGRTLGVFKSVMTLCGSFVGAMTLLVYTAFVYTFGISALWIFVGYFIGFWGFIPFALYLKNYSEGKKFYTIVDFFKAKFGKRIALLVVSVIFIWYYGTLSAQLVGGGKVLQELTNIDYKIATIIICVIIIIYIFFGGFKSVITTDVFQFMAMGIILIVIAFTLRQKLELPISHMNPFNAGAVNIIAFLLFGLATPFATQDYWQKVYAMKNTKVVKHSFAISGVLVLFISIFLTYVGLVARSSFPSIDPDMAFLHSMVKLTPTFLKGIVGISFFAAILSTSDTFLFLLAVNLTNDFINLKGKQLEKRVRYTRLAVILIGLSALGLALLLPKIVDLAIIFKSIGLVVSPVVLFIWSRKESPLAIIVSISISAIIVIILALSGYAKPELAFVSMFLSALIYFVVYNVKKVMNAVNSKM